jgi:hypothetical protein
MNHVFRFFKLIQYLENRSSAVDLVSLVSPAIEWFSAIFSIEQGISDSTEHNIDFVGQANEKNK